MIVVIGKSGQLAQELKATSGIREVRLLGRNEINLFNQRSLTETLNSLRPTAVINASAYTAVDKAESDKESAYELNCDAVKNLAEYCETEKVRFIHVSTDFVFDGEKSSPYDIADTTQPLNVYGKSKLAGEQEILNIMRANFTIVRTSWLYSSFGSNFVKTMLRLMNERSELRIVSDQVGSPTYARGLAEFIWDLAKEDEIESIYHYSDHGIASWYDFAMAIQQFAFDEKIIDVKIPIRPIPSSDYPTAAKRPSYSVLKCSNRIENCEHWQTNLHLMLKLLKCKSN